MLASDLGGGDGHHPPRPVIEVVKAKLAHREGRVDQDIALGFEASENVDLIEQGGVLDDHGIREHHWLPDPDLAVSDTTKGHDRGTSALRAEARECLGVTAFIERRDR